MDLAGLGEKLRSGADVNARDPFGRTAAHYVRPGSVTADLLFSHSFVGHLRPICELVIHTYHLSVLAFWARVAKRRFRKEKV